MRRRAEEAPWAQTLMMSAAETVRALVQYEGPSRLRESLRAYFEGFGVSDLLPEIAWEVIRDRYVGGLARLRRAADQVLGP